MNKSGIYKIVNSSNSKVYIGSAVNLNRRRIRHFYLLNKNSHTNEHLQNAFNQYGEANFVFEIIEYVEDKTKLIQREQFWIDELNVCNPKIGYNICEVAGSRLGQLLSNQTKEKISNSVKGHNRKHTEGTKFKIKEKLISIGHKPSFKGYKWKESSLKLVSNQVINLDTEEVFISIREAGRFYNIASSSITDVCNGKRKTAGGYRWKKI